MTTLRFSSRLSSRLIVSCCALGCVLLTACSTPIKSPLPDALIPPANEQAAFTWGAVGTQNYECKASATGALAWAFVAPEAALFNANNSTVGFHGAGPHWTALDGSKTVGEVKARAPAQRGADIPWLLLATKSAGGPGKMANISSVQRINTVGGIAPATGCTQAADLGKTSKQGYTADYVYFVPRQ
jgi:Protein of unknown function (DUF3455)